VVEVADTGVGIPPELLPRVTEPFFTTKPEGKGTGLGLAICRRIVRQHQGTIDVESRPGEGTTVRVTLPVRPDTNVAGLHAG
jgi:signal transduction histidine kinase